MQLHENLKVSTTAGITSPAEVQATRQRIIFLESLCMELKAAADQSRMEADRSRKALTTVEIRFTKLNHHAEELEREVLKKGEEIIELSQKVAYAETKRTESEAGLSSFKKRMNIELQLTQLELEKERRMLQNLSGKFEDAQMRLSYLQSSYERLFEKMFELYGTIQSEQSEKFDLAEFIADMRAEIVSLEELLAHSKAREKSLQDALETNLEKLEDQTILTHATNISLDNGLPVDMTYDSWSKTEPTSAKNDNPENPTMIVRELLTPSDRPLASRYIAELENGPDSVREHAGARLIELLGKHAAAFIINAARLSSSAVVRACLVSQLATTHDTLLLPVILRFMDDPEYTVRIAALDSCCNLASDSGTDWLATVEKGLKDVSPFVRRRAAMHTAMAKHRDAGPLCRHLLFDPDPTTRRLAAASTASTRDPQTVLALLSCIEDDNAQVLSSAAHSIEQLLAIPASEFLNAPPAERKIIVNKLAAYISSSKNTLYPDGILIEKDLLAAALPDELWRSAPVVQEPVPQGASESTHEDEKPQFQPPQVVVVEEKPIVKEKPAEKAAGLLPFHRIKNILQSSIFGITDEELQKELACTHQEAAETIATYMAEGKVLRRGKKLFLS
ncbi:MAG: HEAT repeat domain-containing protein [Chitinivibrionales bacterium]|nr:HEAT repeat domain-containing protein [Chitinivibrionales bacterium]